MARSWVVFIAALLVGACTEPTVSSPKVRAGNCGVIHVATAPDDAMEIGTAGFRLEYRAWLLVHENRLLAGGGWVVGDHTEWQYCLTLVPNPRATYAAFILDMSWDVTHASPRPEGLCQWIVRQGLLDRVASCSHA